MLQLQITRASTSYTYTCTYNILIEWVKIDIILQNMVSLVCIDKFLTNYKQDNGLEIENQRSDFFMHLF